MQTKSCCTTDLTFFRPYITYELNLAAPDVKGIQNAVRITGDGMRENILVGTLLSTQATGQVLPYSDQNRPIEQHKVEPVLDK